MLSWWPLSIESLLELSDTGGTSMIVVHHRYWYYEVRKLGMYIRLLPRGVLLSH